MKAEVIRKGNGQQKLNHALKALKKASVLVGIARGSDKDKRDGEIGNADLGLIHEFGAPSAGIPARPFLVPGVESAQSVIDKRMGQAMQFAVKGEEAKAFRVLEILGQQVRDKVKNYMRTADFVPLKPATIENRNRSRMTKGKRAEEVVGGNIRPLINTGTLLNSIDAYVEK